MDRHTDALLTGNGRLLVVDDDKLILRALKRALRPHEVDTAETIDEGLAHVAANGAYGLVLCDLTLGCAVSGTDFYHALAARSPGAERAVVFMTGWPKDSERNFLETLPNSYIMKPFNIAEVRELAAARLGRVS